MGLRRIIRRVLSEESEKGLVPSIYEFINLTLGEDYNDIICNIKVTHPKDRQVLQYQTEPHKHYRIDITFKGDTQDYYNPIQINKFEKIVSQIEKDINKFFGLDVAIFYKVVNEC